MLAFLPAPGEPEPTCMQDETASIIPSAFDEIAELIGAFDFIHSVANKMVGQQRDYTEVTYQTKDNLRFGFYQSDSEQQAFIDVGGYGQSLFISVSKATKLEVVYRGGETALDESRS